MAATKTQKQMRAEYKTLLREIKRDWKKASGEGNPFRQNIASYFMEGMQIDEIQSFAVKLGWACALAWATGIGEPKWGG